jgi:hypothetical protein
MSLVGKRSARILDEFLFTSPPTCYPAGMAKLFGDDWPVSSRPAKLVICVIVFALGIAAGAAIAMWVMPPS